MARPKYSGTPGKGTHGVPDKQAHKVGRKWQQQNNPAPAPAPTPKPTPKHKK